MRETERKRERDTERERERELGAGSSLQAVSTELDAGLRLRNREILT